MDGFDSTSQRYLLRVFTGQPGAKPKIATWKTGTLVFVDKRLVYIYIYIQKFIFTHHIDTYAQDMCSHVYVYLFVLLYIYIRGSPLRPFPRVLLCPLSTPKITIEHGIGCSLNLNIS